MPRFHTFVSRQRPSPEVPKMYGDLRFFPDLRRAVGLEAHFKLMAIPAGPLFWSHWRGKTPAQVERLGYWLFNVGRGRRDQHGQPEYECSIDAVRAFGDYIAHRKYLGRQHALISGNDAHATRLSRNGKRNIRVMLDGLNERYPTDFALVMDIVALGFEGAAFLAKNGDEREDPFGEKDLLEGVQAYCPDRLDEFKARFEEGIECVRQHWLLAKRDYRLAGSSPERPRKIQYVYHEGSRTVLKLGYWRSDSIRAAQYARRLKFDLAVIQRLDGSATQIVTGRLRLPDGVKRLGIGAPMVAALREAEYKARGEAVPEGVDLSVWGHVDEGDSWFRAEFAGYLANRTLGNMKPRVTQLPGEAIFEIACDRIRWSPLVDDPRA